MAKRESNQSPSKEVGRPADAGGEDEARERSASGVRSTRNSMDFVGS